MAHSHRIRYVLFGLAGVAGLVTVAFIVTGNFLPGFALTPPASFGAPLRTGNRVYLLTGQWKSVISFSDDSPEASDLLVDLWAFDVPSLKPVYRRRLQKIRRGAMDGRSILGAQNRTLWLLLPAGPHAVNRETGDIMADPETIMAANPSLRGLLPTESQFYKFSDKGLAVKTADARIWHIHPDTFAATDTPATATPAILPAYFTPQATHAFLERGFTLGSKWLGLLTAQEALNFARDHQMGGLDYESRRAVYTANITPKDSFFGPQPRYTDFKQLTEDFLAPGVLADHRSSGRNALVFRRDPDSIFVLHTDRLGENGRLQLARVTGPAGKVLWKSALPLSVLQSMMADEGALLLYGRLYTQQDPKAPVQRDPMHTAREMLVSVNWASGAVIAFDQSDLTKHPEATEVR